MTLVGKGNCWPLTLTCCYVLHFECHWSVTSQVQAGQRLSRTARAGASPGKVPLHRRGWRRLGSEKRCRISSASWAREGRGERVGPASLCGPALSTPAWCLPHSPGSTITLAPLHTPSPSWCKRSRGLVSPCGPNALPGFLASVPICKGVHRPPWGSRSSQAEADSRHLGDQAMCILRALTDGTTWRRPAKPAARASSTSEPLPLCPARGPTKAILEDKLRLFKVTFRGTSFLLSLGYVGRGPKTLVELHWRHPLG